MIKTTLALTLCLFALPMIAKAENDDKGEKKGKSQNTTTTEMTNAEIRKEKKKFTLEVRSMKEAKNHKEGQHVIHGKFSAK